MKADSLNAKDLFEKNVRYVVPTFQRPYVWNLEDQWEPLWNDVAHAAERYLDARAEGLEGPKAEEAAGRHFLGAIVVQQELHGAAEIETRNVIDGQQRLTTIQLLIDAAQEVAEEHNWEHVAEGLSDLVLNNKRYARTDASHVFKLWPTAGDRDAFEATMRNGASTKAFGNSQIVGAHEYFKLQIADWVHHAPESEQQERVHALETALLGLLELVVIDLGTGDDAFVIFETLNARGTPLRASDLVKNYVMQQAAAEGLDIDEVHAEYWQSFETGEGDNWWQGEVRQGRLRRPRLDILLDYWLEIRRAEEVPSHAVFPAFKAEQTEAGQPISELLGDLNTAAGHYRAFVQEPLKPDEDQFAYRWSTIDAGTSTPLILWMRRVATETGSGEAYVRALGMLESFLVRRMVCRLTAKDYNRLFLDALSVVKPAHSSAFDDVLGKYLASQTADSRFWPSDAEFETALVSQPLYRLLTRSRLRMILEAIEDDHRGPKTEDQQVARGKLTIEHVMPQQWESHWPLPEVADTTLASLERSRAIHTIGNLTLVTKSLNPSMSNSAWESKRKALADYSTLLITRPIVNHEGTWDDAAIRERSHRLAADALTIWPNGNEYLSK